MRSHCFNSSHSRPGSLLELSQHKPAGQAVGAIRMELLCNPPLFVSENVSLEFDLRKPINAHLIEVQHQRLMPLGV